MQTRTFLRRVLLAGAAAVTLSGAVPAQATLFLTGGFVDSPALGFSVASPSYSGPAGGFSGIWDPLGAAMPINYWCYQLDQVFSPGTSYNYTASILFYPDLSRLFTEVGGSGAALANNITSAAFQLAIWELEYDTDHKLSTGTFKVTLPGGGAELAAYNQAQAWLDGLAGYSPAYTIILLHSDTNQDFITDFRIPQRDLLPEPSSLPLLGLGLAALVFGMRRRGVQASRL